MVEGFSDGVYSVRWYDPLTGVLYGGEEAVANGGILAIPLHPFQWDIAFIVDDSPVAIEEKRQNLEFEMYPNPALAGSEIKVDWPSANDRSGQVSLLDMAGRELSRVNVFSQNTNAVSVHLPAEWPAGLYWLKLENNGEIGTKAFMVVR
jgi:hypothetical protein